MTIPTPAQLRQSFAPKITLDEIELTAEVFTEIESDAFYKLLEEFTARYKPSFQDKYEAKWEHVYLPIERDGMLVYGSHPLPILQAELPHQLWRPLSHGRCWRQPWVGWCA